MCLGLLSCEALNVTVLSGSTVILPCQSPTSSYSGYFEWRFYSRSQTGGRQIYGRSTQSADVQESDPEHYHLHGDYGLEISAVEWQDGGVYGCHFLTGDIVHYSSVTVVGK